MIAVDAEVREAIKGAIDAYRLAWLESVSTPEFREGILPATMTGEDTPAAWRAYEAGKRILKAENNLVGIFEAHRETFESVRYQGIRYSLRRTDRWDDRRSSFNRIEERPDDALDLDWPLDLKPPPLPEGPKTW